MAYKTVIKDFWKWADITDTLKFAKSSISHVLIQSEANQLKSKGLVFICLQQPTWSHHGNDALVNWITHSVSQEILSLMDLQQSSIAIVTTYHNLKTDKMLSFVGSIPNQSPSNDDYILLGWSNRKSEDQVQEEVEDGLEGTNLCKLCDDAKHPTGVEWSSYKVFLMVGRGLYPCTVFFFTVFFTVFSPWHM